MVAELLGPAQAAGPGGGMAESWWLQALGWVGQAFFSARVIIQWFASERARRPVAPPIFWLLSVVGAVVMSAYCLMRSEPVLLPGYLVTLAIYLRNLRLQSREDASERSVPRSLLALGFLVVVGAAALAVLGDHARQAAPVPWIAVAILGQALWIGRFLVQWRHAERHGRSEFPPAFWWMTIAGGCLNTAYSMHRVDLPLIFGFLFSGLAPARNLMLHHRHQRTAG